MRFFEKYQKVRKARNSVLCVGLDPVSLFMQEKDAVPRPYFEKAKEPDALFRFCLDLIQKTKKYACAYKVNAQYALPFSLEQLQAIGREIEEAGALGIFDLKLSDIEHSNASAMYWIKKSGFDAFTFSPFAGNIGESVAQARKEGLGIFILALMSNAGAKYFMKENLVEGVKGFEWIIGESVKHHADGFVVGATNPPDQLRICRELAGNEAVFLVPGIGRQGGDAPAALKILGENVLVNVGRDVIYSEDPQEKAKEYQQLLNAWVGKT